MLSEIKFLILDFDNGKDKPELKAKIMGYGERLPAEMLHYFLLNKGVNSVVLEPDVIGLVTTVTLMDSTVNLERSRSGVLEHIGVVPADSIPVVTGFFGVSEDGRTALFGRNGSDITAVVIAEIIGSDIIIFYIDVGGLLTGGFKDNF
ncbi:MAG: hypothetical protein QXO03_02335 [Thermoplasmatales archaeon]